MLPTFSELSVILSKSISFVFGKPFWLLVLFLSGIIGAYYYLFSITINESVFLDDFIIILFIVPFCLIVFLISFYQINGALLGTSKETFPFQNFFRQISYGVFLLVLLMYHYMVNIYPESNLQACFEEKYPLHISFEAYYIAPWIIAIAYGLALQLFRHSKKKILMTDIVWIIVILYFTITSYKIFSLLEIFEGCSI